MNWLIDNGIIRFTFGSTDDVVAFVDQVATAQAASLGCPFSLKKGEQVVLQVTIQPPWYYECPKPGVVQLKWMGIDDMKAFLLSLGPLLKAYGIELVMTPVGEQPMILTTRV